MASESVGEKLSIKNILFTKAIPNYKLPAATTGFKTFPCTDCGDKFLFESSFNDHINRKSLKITFSCRYCNKIIICKNRCRFLSHIRSHSFKTTTINVNDLKIEPLPLQDINWTVLAKKNTPIESQYTIEKPNETRLNCYECKQTIERTEKTCEDRAKHYIKYTNMVYSCPICLFALPNSCSLIAHLRIHLRIPPYYCPECGVHLSSMTIAYPYNHNCEGFNMIRVTTRLKCKHHNCNTILHPNDYKIHIRNHLKKMYKCVKCCVVWDETPPKKHYPCNNDDKIIIYLECELCSNKTVDKTQVNNHINMHFRNTMNMGKSNAFIYPCMSCSLVCNEISSLIKHQMDEHAPNELKILLLKILNQYNLRQITNEKGFYRVIKKCDKCLRSFIYRCEYKNIKILPNECPYKCYESNDLNTLNNKTLDEKLSIVCYLCKRKMRENWEDIKDHFGTFHKNHKCIDVNVILSRIDKSLLLSKNKSKDCLSRVKKNFLKNNKPCRRKSKADTVENNNSLKTSSSSKDSTSGNLICNICKFRCQDKQVLETHIISHRDPCMAYQCLECGQCFVVKPSFSTHLLLEHGIANISEYIDKKQCYNELALLKHPNNSQVEDGPVKENQCKICRDQFENGNDLEKHFRVHGMAFLKKNTNKNNSP